MARVCGLYTAKFWKNSEQRQQIRTYRVPWGTPTLPVPHRFLERYFDPCRDYPDPAGEAVGRDKEQRLYDKGITPAWRNATGEFCGSPRLWLEGGVLGEDPSLDWLQDGRSTCCVEHTQGGIVGTANTVSMFTGAGQELQDAPLRIDQTSGRLRSSVCVEFPCIWVNGYEGLTATLLGLVFRDGLFTGGTPSVDVSYINGLGTAALHDHEEYAPASAVSAPTSYATTVGDGVSTSFTITHGLGTRDLAVTVWEAAPPYGEVIATVKAPTTDSLTISFAVPPASDQFRVMAVKGGYGGAPPAPAAFSGARVFNSSNLSIAAAGWTPLTFDDEHYDTDGYHSALTNTSRLTIPVAGYYAIGGHVRWGTPAAECQHGLRINRGGGIALAEVMQQSSISAGLPTITQQSVVTHDYLGAGDYVELEVFQGSGSSLNVIWVDRLSPEFWISFLGS